MRDCAVISVRLLQVCFNSREDVLWLCHSFCSADRVWFSLQILHHLQPERPDCREKLDKILQQIKWPNFPGVVVMLLKVWLVVFFVARASLA